MRTATSIRTVCLIAAVACLALPGCSTPHSQQVRQEARDRFDRAGAQIAYDQARQSFNGGQFESAMGYIDRAIARFPKESSYYLLRGRIQNEMKRTEEARESFAKSIELDPRKPEPHYFMGIVYQRWRQLDQALAKYAEAARLDPGKLHYLCAEVEVMTAMGRLDEASARVDAVSTRFEFSPVIERLKADIAKARGQDVACADLLEQAAYRVEEKADILEELAFARYSSRDWQGTLAVLDSPELKPIALRPDIVRLRARCLLMMGRAAEARDALVPIMGQADPDGRTRLLMGNAAWRAGDWKRLRQAGEDLIVSHPTRADGYLFVGGANFGMGDFTESIVYFEQAMAREPERATCKRMLEESTRHAAALKGPNGPRADSRPAAAGAVRTEAP